VLQIKTSISRFFSNLPRYFDSKSVAAQGKGDFRVNSGEWKTVVLNNDEHTFAMVEYQVVRATGCSTAQAIEIAKEIHAKGEAIACRGAKEHCDAAATILEEIGLRVRVEQVKPGNPAGNAPLA
jgi:ATP-dependent Clp protease adapter protein ClpS